MKRKEAKQHNAAALAATLPWQCRLDPRRRYMRPNSCAKAPLKNIKGEIISECMVCPGPIK